MKKTKITTAIILAAGFGTRLKSVVKDIPKPMADINGKPFLEYLIKYLENNGITKIILHIGYLGNIIKNHFGNKYNSIEIIYSEVETPIGTGGGINDSLKYIPENEQYVLALNGDSFLDVDIQDYYQKFLNSKSKMALTLKPMTNYDRYGTVITDKNNKITQFQEKMYKEKGDINGGIYIINKTTFKKLAPEEIKFSFERDILEKYVSESIFSGFEYDGYFIDIGLPEDYEKSKEYFK